MSDENDIEHWANTNHRKVIGSIALAAAGFFHDEGGINYVEFGLEGLPDTGPLVITIQRKDGKTPHELRQEAEDRLRDLENSMACPASEYRTHRCIRCDSEVTP